MKNVGLILAFLFVQTVFGQSVTTVYFDWDSHTLTPKTKKTLDSIAALSLGYSFIIQGNCDASGTNTYNQKLSEKRAKNVKDYLNYKTKNLVKITQVIGFGESQQKNDNSTPELQQENRRVVVLWIKNESKSYQKKSPENLFEKTPSKLQKQDTLSLPGIHFYGGRSVWLPSAKKPIQQLLEILKNNPNLNIEIQGHVCCEYEQFDGEDLDTHTFNLSENRANAIRKFLVKNGISGKRLQVKGLGNTKPLVFPEVTENDKTLNRRVEIMILK